MELLFVMKMIANDILFLFVDERHSGQPAWRM